MELKQSWKLTFPSGACIKVRVSLTLCKHGCSRVVHSSERVITFLINVKFAQIIPAWAWYSCWHSELMVVKSRTAAWNYSASTWFIARIDNETILGFSCLHRVGAWARDVLRIVLEWGILSCLRAQRIFGGWLFSYIPLYRILARPWYARINRRVLFQIDFPKVLSGHAECEGGRFSLSSEFTLDVIWNWRRSLYRGGLQKVRKTFAITYWSCSFRLCWLQIVTEFLTPWFY